MPGFAQSRGLLGTDGAKRGAPCPYPLACLGLWLHGCWYWVVEAGGFSAR